MPGRESSCPATLTQPMETRLQELININHASVEILRTTQREQATYPYKMRLSDAKRLINDPMGYEVVRMFLNGTKLTNRHFTSHFDADVEFITIGSKTLVVNHSERSLHIQE
jgi:hypothetical protein